MSWLMINVVCIGLSAFVAGSSKSEFGTWLNIIAMFFNMVIVGVALT